MQPAWGGKIQHSPRVIFSVDAHQTTQASYLHRQCDDELIFSTHWTDLSYNLCMDLSSAIHGWIYLSPFKWMDINHTHVRQLKDRERERKCSIKASKTQKRRKKAKENICEEKQLNLLRFDKIQCISRWAANINRFAKYSSRCCVQMYLWFEHQCFIIFYPPMRPNSKNWRHFQKSPQKLKVIRK